MYCPSLAKPTLWIQLQVQIIILLKHNSSPDLLGAECGFLRGHTTK